MPQPFCSCMPYLFFIYPAFPAHCCSNFWKMLSSSNCIQIGVLKLNTLFLFRPDIRSFLIHVLKWITNICTINFYRNFGLYFASFFRSFILIRSYLVLKWAFDDVSLFLVSLNQLFLLLFQPYAFFRHLQKVDSLFMYFQIFKLISA